AMRNSSSSRSVPGESRIGGTSRRRKPSRARNSHIRSSPSPLNSEALMTKSHECSSRRFNVYALSLWSIAKADRPDEMKRPRPMQTDAEEPIEAGKMIHVSVRYEGMAHAQELAR